MLKTGKQILYLLLSVTSIIGARRLYELARYCKSSYCSPGGGICTADCIYHIDTSNLILSGALLILGLMTLIIAAVSFFKSRKT